MKIYLKLKFYPCNGHYPNINMISLFISIEFQEVTDRKIGRIKKLTFIAVMVLLELSESDTTVFTLKLCC